MLLLLSSVALILNPQLVIVLISAMDWSDAMAFPNIDAGDSVKARQLHARMAGLASGRSKKHYPTLRSLSTVIRVGAYALSRSTPSDNNLLH